MTRSRLLAGAAVLAAAASALSPVSSAASTEGMTGGASPTYLLGPDGVVYSWRIGEGALGPLPPTLAGLDARPVTGLGLSQDGGTMVVLFASAPATSKKRGHSQGSAVVVSTPPAPAPPAILSEIPFDGDGSRVAVTADGHRAFVLALRAGPEGTVGPPRSWLHALDLDAGRVVSSAQLDRPPAAIALDPAAVRIFLAYPGRVVSYTTQPLARSWHYRSPGANRGLYFRPGSAVLHSVRIRQIALFDPVLIAALKPEERQGREDDATRIVSLPFTADLLLFSRDGLLAAAQGPGNELAFIDSGTAEVFAAKEGDGDIDPLQEARPFYFGAGPGDLVVASFPGRQVRLIHPPARPLESRITERAAVEAPPPASAPSPTPAPATAPVREPSPARESSTIPQPPPTPILVPEAPATAAAPPPPPGPGSVLAGRLTGRIEAVRSIVVYGPGSIVREQARALPGGDGAWRIPLPPPGIYRIVPLGESSRPLHSDPNFLTVEVKDQGRTDLDFSILGTS